jgi:hypothetical protein
MSTIPSNLAFTALQLKVAAANADQKSRIAPVQVSITPETKPENVLQAQSKLFEGLNQQAVLHFQVGQALRAKAQAKEPQMEQIKSVIIAPNFKKESKEPASFVAGHHEDEDKPTSLFAGLDLAKQDDGTVDPDAE